MSLFSDIFAKLPLGQAGIPGIPAEFHGMVGIVQTMLAAQPGGLAGLVATLQDGGLGPVVGSWIGAGPNQAVAPEQIQAALGPVLMARLVAGTGMTETQLSGTIAQHLPMLIDRLTPNGQVPTNANSLMEIGMALLRGRPQQG